MRSVSRVQANLAGSDVIVPVGVKAITNALSGISAPGTEFYLPRQFMEYHRYDLAQLSKLQSTDLIRLLVYVEPNVSHAISNYLRMFDSGYYLTAKKPNGSTHQQGEQFLSEVLLRLNNPGGNGFLPDTSLNKFILELAIHMLLDGAISAEVIFNQFRSATGLQSIDPATIDFKDKNGRIIPIQRGLVGEILLDYRSIFYVPVDPIGGDPYGTNQILSAIQPVMNKFRLLQDFARVLHNLGFDRINVTINQQQILDSCRTRGITDPHKIVDELKRVLAEAKSAFQTLEPDDSPVHLDTLTLDTLEGKNVSKGVDVQAVVNVLLAEIASGLKTYATIIGKRFGGSSEGYTSVEALLFIKLVEGFQGILKRLLDRIFTLILQVEGGIQAYASWEWMEPSLRPKYESAQYQAVYAKILWDEENFGSISQEERNGLIRKMLGQAGPPPASAERVPGYGMNLPQTNPNDPQRGSIQEAGKETKRADTNRTRKTGGQNSSGMSLTFNL